MKFQVGMQAVPVSRRAGPLGMVPTAVANGVGIGVIQTLVMHGDVFGRALLPGTLYATSCTHLNVFSVSAFCALGMLLMNVLLSIIGWTVAYQRNSERLMATMLLLHVLASLSTLLNDSGIIETNGCTVALPALFAVVAVTIAFTATVLLRELPTPAGDGSSS